jgi:hypothetical protein
MAFLTENKLFKISASHGGYENYGIQGCEAV